MEIQYINNLPETYRQQAIDLYFAAFNRKLGPIFRNLQKAKELFFSHIDSSFCISAMNKNELVGILAYSSKKGAFSNMHFSDFYQSFGFLNGLYSFMGLSLFNHQVREDEWYIDAIAVADTYRGQGVGTGLLNLIEKQAFIQGAKTIALDVVDTNPRAKALYERYGFVGRNREHIWPVKWLYPLPFDSSLIMEKNLN